MLPTRPAVSEVLTAATVFLGIGVAMNAFGTWAGIAHFRYPWQIATCYLGFVLPLAFVVRRFELPLQLCICAAAFLPLEIGGYGMGSSVAEAGNVIDRLLGEHNFTAVMVLLVTWIPIAGLRVSERIHRRLFAVARGAVS